MDGEDTIEVEAIVFGYANILDYRYHRLQCRRHLFKILNHKYSAVEHTFDSNYHSLPSILQKKLSTRGCAALYAKERKGAGWAEERR